MYINDLIIHIFINQSISSLPLYYIYAFSLQIIQLETYYQYQICQTEIQLFYTQLDIILFSLAEKMVRHDIKSQLPCDPAPDCLKNFKSQYDSMKGFISKPKLKQKIQHILKYKFQSVVAFYLLNEKNQNKHFSQMIKGFINQGQKQNQQCLFKEQKKSKNEYYQKIWTQYSQSIDNVYRILSESFQNQIKFLNKRIKDEIQNLSRKYKQTIEESFKFLQRQVQIEKQEMKVKLQQLQKCLQKQNSNQSIKPDKKLSIDEISKRLRIDTKQLQAYDIIIKMINRQNAEINQFQNYTINKCLNKDQKNQQLDKLTDIDCKRTKCHEVYKVISFCDSISTKMSKSKNSIKDLLAMSTSTTTNSINGLDSSSSLNSQLEQIDNLFQQFIQIKEYQFNGGFISNIFKQASSNQRSFACRQQNQQKIFNNLINHLNNQLERCLQQGLQGKFRNQIKTIFRDLHQFNKKIKQQTQQKIKQIKHQRQHQYQQLNFKKKNDQSNYEDQQSFLESQSVQQYSIYQNRRQNINNQNKDNHNKNQSNYWFQDYVNQKKKEFQQISSQRLIQKQDKSKQKQDKSMQKQDKSIQKKPQQNIKQYRTQSQIFGNNKDQLNKLEKNGKKKHPDTEQPFKETGFRNIFGEKLYQRNEKYEQKPNKKQQNRRLQSFDQDDSQYSYVDYQPDHNPNQQLLQNNYEQNLNDQLLNTQDATVQQIILQQIQRKKKMSFGIGKLINFGVQLLKNKNQQQKAIQLSRRQHQQRIIQQSRHQSTIQTIHQPTIQNRKVAADQQEQNDQFLKIALDQSMQLSRIEQQKRQKNKFQSSVMPKLQNSTGPQNIRIYPISKVQNKSNINQINDKLNVKVLGPLSQNKVQIKADMQKVHSNPNIQIFSGNSNLIRMQNNMAQQMPPTNIIPPQNAFFNHYGELIQIRNVTSPMNQMNPMNIRQQKPPINIIPQKRENNLIDLKNTNNYSLTGKKIQNPPPSYQNLRMTTNTNQRSLSNNMGMLNRVQNLNAVKNINNVGVIHNVQQRPRMVPNKPNTQENTMFKKTMNHQQIFQKGMMPRQNTSSEHNTSFGLEDQFLIQKQNDISNFQQLFGNILNAFSINQGYNQQIERSIIRSPSLQTNLRQRNTRSTNQPLTPYLTIEKLLKNRQYLCTEKQDFGIFVKVLQPVLLTYQRLDNAKNPPKVKLIVGDETGIAILYMNYYLQVKAGTCLKLDSCRLNFYKYADSYEIGYYKPLKLNNLHPQNKIKKINRQIKLSVIHHNHLNQLKYEKGSHQNQTLSNSVRNFLQARRNRPSQILKKPIIVTVCKKFRQDRYIIGDYSGRMKAHLTKVRIENGDTLMIRNAVINQQDKQFYISECQHTRIFKANRNWKFQHDMQFIPEKMLDRTNYAS